MHEAIIQRISQADEKGKLGHALLLTGGGGRGAYAAAIRIAQTLLCPSGALSSECPECNRIRHLSHPDFLFVAPLPPRFGEGGTANREGGPPSADPVSAALRDDLYAPLNVGANWKIGSDQADDLVSWAWRTPWQASRKVALVAEVDSINELIADKLLKTLEEPPEAVTFLLVTSKPQNLLPTVRSRCQIVAVPPLSRDELAGLLVERGTEKSEADAIALLANGDIWAALALSRGGAAGMRQQAFALVETTLDARKKPAQVIEACRGLLAPRGASRLLPSEEAALVGDLSRWIAWCLRDVLAHLEGARETPDELRNILPVARKIGAARLFSWLEEVDRTHEMATRNVSALPALIALAMYPREDRRVFRDPDGRETVTFPPLTLSPST